MDGVRGRMPRPSGSRNRQPQIRCAAAPGRGGAAGRWWVRVAGWLLVSLFGLLAAAVALVPPPASGGGAPTLLYDRYGDVVGSLGSGRRDPVDLAQVPRVLQEATIATEDASFYANHGFHIAALVRAALRDVRARGIVEGGSTITQQLAKTLYLSPARTWRRKLEEVVYTLRLEATHSKPQILQMYLNSINYGEGAYGVAAAAETYFSQNVSTLDLAQSALLAGLPNAPQAYDPFLHPAAARARQRWVLHRMVVARFISTAEAQAAAAEPLRFVRPSTAASGPPAGYFFNYILAEIRSHDPALETAVARGGYRIYTTLDPAVQAAADSAFSHYMPPGKRDAQGTMQPQGALVAIDPRNGSVLALVGGRSYAATPYNRAVYAKRQPASTFKPILYAAAIASGHTVTERQFDGPVTYTGADGRAYTVRDDGPYQMRWLTMREAMALSTNVVAVKWAQTIGPAAVIRMARRMGLTSPLQPTLPLVLGAYDVTPLQMVDAYVPLANQGVSFPPWGVVRVVGPGGETVWRPHAPIGQRAMSPGVAYIVTSLLESVMTEGTGSALQGIVGRPAAGKSGTTNASRDAWFIGYTPQLVAGVWVGDDQPAPLKGGGSALAGPVWAHFMADALAGRTPSAWEMPGDVVALRVSATDGLLPNPGSATVTEVFLRGTEPTRTGPPAGDTGPSPGLVGLPWSQLIPPFLGTIPVGPPPAGDTAQAAEMPGASGSIPHPGTGAEPGPAPEGSGTPPSHAAGA